MGGDGDGDEDSNVATGGGGESEGKGGGGGACDVGGDVGIVPTHNSHPVDATELSDLHVTLPVGTTPCGPRLPS